MKKVLFYLVLLSLCVYVYYNQDTIVKLISKILLSNKAIVEYDISEYYKETEYSYVQNTKDFLPYTKQDIRNIIYEVINRGYETFTFYCPVEYDTCVDDFLELNNDNNIIFRETVNNLVSPYNMVIPQKITANRLGEISIEYTKKYTQEQIKSINNQIDIILKEIIKDDMSTKDKLLAIHDYIINNTKYDINYETDKSKESSSAYGVLLNGYGICQGYAETYALFLNKLNIDNFMVSTENHTWNAVKVDNKYYHVDLTWDDPVIENSDEDMLLHKFFLIDTKRLEEYNTGSHNFNKTIYSELS